MILALGLDPSLTSTGIAPPVDVPFRLKSKPGAHPAARLAAIRDAVLRVVTVSRANVVAIEGYSFASHAAHAHELGALGGLLRVALWEADVPYAEVPPATLKKYATGKGNASKEEVLGAAIRRLGYTGDHTDEADALWLRAMAHDFYNIGATLVPASHRAALDAVAWPKLPKAARV